MKITLAVLFLAGLTIYCKCVAVLSLPPSLIAHAASLDDSLKTQKSSAIKDNEIKQQQSKKKQANEAAASLYRNFKNLRHNNLSLNLKKREHNTFDHDTEDNVGILHQPMAVIKNDNKNSNSRRLYDDNKQNKNNNNKNVNKFFKVTVATLNNEDNFKHSYNSHEWFKPKQDKMDVIIDSSLIEKSKLKREAPTELKILNHYIKPLKYLTKQCTLENENNCLREYYSDLIADRNNALLNQLQHKLYVQPFASYSNDINVDDIALLLTAEQNLLKFLSWTLGELYPLGKFTNTTDNGADFYHPSMFMWKKLNLSGRLEPPLKVEEPHYVIVRRELNSYEEDDDYKRGLHYSADPFIPPRGRKHKLLDLDSLLHRYETFVPNRGRRDKIKDIFKNDDLFYPNRGKRQMIASSGAPIVPVDDNGDIDESNEIVDDVENQKQHYYVNEENDDRQQLPYLLLSNTLMKYIENLMTKMKRNLCQNQQRNDEKVANCFDEMSNRNQLTRMSTTFQQAPPAKATPPLRFSSSLLNKRSKLTFNILHNQQQHHLPNHSNARRQWWKKCTTAEGTNNNNGPISTIRSPTIATNRLQALRSMSPLQKLIQLYRQQYQQASDLSPSHMMAATTKFMEQQQKQQKSLPQQFDPLFSYKLQMLQQQKLLQHQYNHHHQPLLTKQHLRLTALQHLPIRQQQQQLEEQLATPQETQFTYSPSQTDYGITNDLDNFGNKELD